VPHRKDKANQAFFFAYIGVTLIVLPYLFNAFKVYQYVQVNAPSGYMHSPRIEDLAKVTLYVLGFALVQRVLLYLSTPFFTSIVKDSDVPELRDKYVRKCNESVIKTVFYGFLITHTRNCLHGTKLLPWYLGGTIGSFDAVNEGMPFIELPPGVADCVLLFMSQYVHLLIDLLLDDHNRPDFNETLLHHICAVALTLCTFLGNSRGIGILIAYLHALSEIPVNFARIFSSTHYATPTAVAGVAMVLVFFYTRIVVFPYIVWRMWHRRHPGLPQLDGFCTFEAIFLSVL